MGLPLQRTDSGKPFHIHDNFPAFPAANRFFKIVLAIVFPLLADSGNLHTFTNSFELQRETYSRYLFNSGRPISAIIWLASC
jgi:hypothetical protein